MAFDKTAQRARAAELEFQMLAKGVQKPAPAQVPVKPVYSVAPSVQYSKSTIAIVKKKEPKMAVNYSAEPFTNHLGQTIQPGQKIICVSQGYNHSTKVGIGEYLGLRRDSRGQVRNVVVTRTLEKYGYQVNGKPAAVRTPGASYGKYLFTGKTSLPSKRIYPTV